MSNEAGSHAPDQEPFHDQVSSPEELVKLNFLNPEDAEKTKTYLSWLAWHMKHRDIETFYLENLQPEWLKSNRELAVYRVIVILVFGLAFGLTIGLTIKSYHGLISGLLSGLASSLAFGWFTGLARIDIKQLFNFSLRAILIRELSFGFAFGIAFGFIGGLVVWLENPIEPTVQTIIIGLVFGLLPGLASGLVFGIAGGVSGAIAGALATGLAFGSRKSTSVQTAQHINQGFWDTYLFRLAVRLTFGLAFGIVVGRAFGWFIGLAFGLTVGLISGLSHNLKHVILRMMLWRQRTAPLWFGNLYLTHRRNYLIFQGFLFHAENLHLMRRVGGGFMFNHRYIMEYFADQYQPTKFEQKMVEVYHKEA